MANNVSLLSSNSRVETPFVKVTIGDYVFGVVKKTNVVVDDNQVVKGIQYPNFIDGLEIDKINGSVNRYTLNIRYPVTQYDDPNFFEKVFSSISNDRKIIFEYGDMSNPTFCYKREEALFLKATQSVSLSSSVITYKVSAISNSNLLSMGNYTFGARYDKPSNVIRELLYSSGDTYGLLDVFPGMANRSVVDSQGIIFSDDRRVNLEMMTNVSVLDYISYLVSCMRTESTLNDTPMFSLVVVDDTSGIFGGAYFKVQMTNRYDGSGFAYDLDIGFPSQNVVTDFRVTTDDSYSIYYDFEEKLNDAKYVARIDDEGKIVDAYAPSISSGTLSKTTTESQRSWWNNVTQFPIKASVTVRGLLKPALLMTNVRLNVYFFGRKHVSSGLYVVTGEKDYVNESGFRTALSLLRVDSVSMQ